MTAIFERRMKGPWYASEDAEGVKQFWLELDTTTHAALHRHDQFLSAVVSGSPYLRGLMLADTAFTLRCLTLSPEEIFRSICQSCAALSDTIDFDTLKSELRKLKSQSALLIALCDIAGVWSLMEVTQALTAFADCALRAAVDFLMREAHLTGKLSRINDSNYSENSGYVVLAMGKHGAGELNYSSDIDLIILYDADAAPLAENVEPAKFFVRLTQRLVDIMQDITMDGYVFRTDLRLRPDPRATQVAIAIESAAVYYESLGQNWERAAYIKARAVAGDIKLGEEFLDRLKPYIWRKYLDFASINDIQSLIRQIHAVKGHGEIAVQGHNLKLGRGGIREIEFFVQTQQLIAGGRNPALRGRSTISMLQELAKAQWISSDTANDLQQAYIVLRTLEHRAQMVDDQQTHLVPTDAKFKRFACFSGYESPEVLATRLRITLETVRNHSMKLFEGAQGLAAETGSLVFTGGEDDPDTLATLSRLGYGQPSEVSGIIRGWHFGSYHATRDRRAREALTELMPKLLIALARGGDADRTFFDFDVFLKGLPAGVQLLSMLRANPSLLDLVAQILSTAPRLAHGLSRQPRVLEAVLEPGFFDALPSPQALQTVLAETTTLDATIDEIMDQARVFGREQKFRVGVRVLSDTVSAEAAGLGFTHVADSLLQHLLAASQAEMSRKHGDIPGGQLAVIAMGKLGGREMTAGSDLDLILVYDHPEASEVSTGNRSLSAGQYYARLAQRFITSISAPTAEGGLYEVDMRLRPSGSKGPVAVSLASFETYQRDSAWTWEKLALTRARIVTAPNGLAKRLQAAILASLCEKRDTESTRTDVIDMRGLMLRSQKPSAVWDIKRVRGGLVEIEFIAQFLQLVHAHTTPMVLDTNTFQVLAKLRDHKLLAPANAQALLDACQLYHRLTQILRLCIEDDFDPHKSMPGLNRALADAAELPDIAHTENLLCEHQARVTALFDNLVGLPK